MVTKEQAMSLGYRDEVHFQNCSREIGSRGGVKIHQTVCRVNGQCKTWKREPNRFYLPVKYGLRDYGSISEDNQNSWHLASECPLNEFTTNELRESVI